ncbi:MAG: hypothetical protein QOF51_728 [Chloroflexota bacterium]|jgi:MFS family permease|nr:hypothetical protein [Chloroflexota bacterium]
MRGLGALRHRDYTLYLSGNGVSSIGSQAESMATPWLLYQLTDSPLQVGLNGLFLALPIFLIVPLAGTLADRLPPRRMLIAADTIALLNSLILGLLVASNWVQPWQVWVEAFVSASVAAFDVTARQSLFPRLVPREQLDDAVNLNFTVSRIGMLSGPAVGGVLITVAGPGSPFFFNAATFLAMVLAAAVVRERHIAVRSRRQSVGADMFAGFAFMARSPVIAAMMTYAALWAILSQNNAMIAIFARDVLHTNADGLGFLLSASAAGQLLGSIGLTAYGEVQRKGLLTLAIAGLYTVAMLGFAFASHLFLAAGLLLLAGIANAIFSVTRHTILQRASPDDLRGRVMGTHLLVTRGVNPLSQTVSGVLVGLLGPVAALVAATVGLAAATLGVALSSPALRNYAGEQVNATDDAAAPRTAEARV